MTTPVARSTGRYALRHVDAAGTTHLWTCVPTSAHWVARWHARDSGRATEVLRDDGEGWRVVSVWTAADGQDPTGPGWSYPDDGCLWDDEDLGRPAAAGWDDEHGSDCGCPGCTGECCCGGCIGMGPCDDDLGRADDEDDQWDDDHDDDEPEEETSWRYRPVIDYAAL